MKDNRFKNRTEAGLLLSKQLSEYKNTNAVVLAIPRGGVPVGHIIAKELQLPLSIVLSKKIGHPNNKEYAIGSVSLDTVITENHTEIPPEYIENEIISLRKKLREKQKQYMGHQNPIDVTNKNVILVDDGIATGNTVLVSIRMLRKSKPAQIIVAVPVVPYNKISLFEKESDVFVYLLAPEDFNAVGEFYEEFNPVEDDEVIRMLNNTPSN
ncbi:phosphoribosyltransferase [Flavobacterium luminosum]|uniref:Phosphoribosyltransferase n=1 Tax=Flavobacterium luminosum TaxID=2949086 RepID=A0ABT0TM67_9FLAO|nr:phosphoribosyltransferase family protein [Flavobacterium sp. HXWNR70]MCL9808184.1 phosphoribosyltransferase [Flavobacterium sp. HXWNR70]